ncbi:MAG: hypothetical protein LUQ05_04880 [Methanoregula sp.]|nr:hypothetical protein [Methanoregula sp.]
MAITELKEAINLLKRLPALWIPGIIGGILTAALWLTLNLSGTFFAGRLLVIFGLVLLLFTTGLLVIIRNNEGDIRTMLTGGIRYYFRVLLPQLIIIFGIILIFTLVMVTFSLIGAPSDVGMVTALSIGFMILHLVMTHMNDVLAFLFICAAIIIGIIFMLMIIWEAFLYDKLEPITRYNETQLQTFTPEQLMAMISPEGMWITAVVLFIGVFLLLPFLFSYKACFFRKLTCGTPVIQQPTTGEFDSKGRWYKY